MKIVKMFSFENKMKSNFIEILRVCLILVINMIFLRVCLFLTIKTININL